MAALNVGLTLCAALVAGSVPRWPQRPQRRGVLLAMQPTAGASLVDGVLAGLTEEDISVVRWLASDEMGQSHLFAGWESAAIDDKRRMLAQVTDMDARYPEDATGCRGLAAYVAHARQVGEKPARPYLLTSHLVPRSLPTRRGLAW